MGKFKMLGKRQYSTDEINNGQITLKVSVLPPIKDLFFGVGAGGYSNLK